ncbi:MAG TPA: molecular chaperone HtpG [Pseudobdellovibrionaceae bacterium]|nr:molecular chaperone HtpG [Pseudobdellovibrionaceae bacterium]
MAKQTQPFNAEIKQLLDIVIHSLYSHREIFLRELISNASDAMDKLKFQALTKPELVDSNHEYAIRLEPNKTEKTLKISDSGIGMSQEEVVEFIGTIAKSGTKAFAQLSQEAKNNPELIGQFGVGFYSAFMVADKVILHTQKAGSSTGVLWESTGDGTYSIDEVPRAEGTGTTITLKLKNFESEEEVKDFTDDWVLKSLVKKYSDFISFPIKMKTEKLSEKDEKESKEIVDETLNSQKALWLKSPSEVTADEYKEFYQHLTHDWSEPLKTVHYKAEGTMEFSSLLFIPSKKPWNFFSKDMEYGLSLYIKRVFIMENSKDLLPQYLRFVKGLVDSSDLSLNVSREILQQNRQVIQIRKNVVGKIFSTLKEMLQKDRPQYENFWSEFGPVLKEGLPSDPTQKEKLQDLLLFHTTQSDKMTTLEEYVERMKPEQKNIFFLTGDNLSQLQMSPYLEKLKQKGYEVLLWVDPVDEWVSDSLKEYKGKNLKSITEEKLDLETEEEKKQVEEKKKTWTEKFQPVIEGLKKDLSEHIKDVVVSDRLTETPACLVSGEHDPSHRMEQLMSQINKDYKGSTTKRILEINPEHAIFERLLTADETKRSEIAEVIYAQALLNEGTQLPDPVKFSKQLSKLMMEAFH